MTREVNGVVYRSDGLKHLSPVRAAALLGLIRAGETLDRRLDAELVRTHGISLRAFEVLLFLAVFAPDRQLRMTDLIAQTPLSQSRVSRLVAELEARGLVRRSSADADRRGVLVTITDRGVQTFKAAQDTHLADLERRLFSRLTDEEIGQLAAITAKILAADGTGETTAGCR
ncbi:MAG TPA: MarR family transcriptional regulator [Micromonosporaceae bacterium]